MFENLLNFFSRPKAGAVAKDRLQVLLTIDRRATSTIPEEIMEQLKEEVMAVINKYLEIENDALDMKFDRTTDSEGRIVSALVANIPISNVKAVKPVKADTTDKGDKPEKTDKTDSAAKAQTPAKTEKSEKTEKTTKSNNGQKKK